MSTSDQAATDIGALLLRRSARVHKLRQRSAATLLLLA